MILISIYVILNQLAFTRGLALEITGFQKIHRSREKVEIKNSIYLHF